MHGKSILRAKKQKIKESKERYQISLEAQRDLLQNAPKPHQEIKLKSIWETSNMEEFLSIADQRENGYMAERNVRVVVGGNVHVVSKDNRIVPKTDERDWFSLSAQLPIPRRPVWHYNTNTVELHTKEKTDFVEWRRGLAQAEESNRVVMTPYEKNLDVWRQLWRVVERSDVVLEILDARNPMVFRCVDLEKYVNSFYNTHNKTKQLILLLNKADLLTEGQRKVWSDYLTARGDRFYFFSALPKVTETKEDTTNATTNHQSSMMSNDVNEQEESCYNSESTASEMADEDVVITKHIRKRKEKTRHNSRRIAGAPMQYANPYELEAFRRKQKEEKSKPKPAKAPKPITAEEIARDARIARFGEMKPYDIVAAEDLIDLLAAMRSTMGFVDISEAMMVGMVGYPNVGKSSTINSIMGCKKVIVSATPGKTKHFQTLVVPNERRVMLCDCPGLIFPSFAATRETMVCDGVLPIDAVKDYVSPIAVVCERIPRVILESIFRISLKKEDDIDDCTSLADRLLSTVARRKGYMTEHNKPNRSTAAKEILKMYVDGKLVFVHPPVGFTPEVPHELADTTTPSPPPQTTNNVTNNTVDATTISATAKRAVHNDDDAEEDWDDDEDGEGRREDEEMWENISSADEARALTDDGNENDVGVEEEEEDHLRNFKTMPLFFARPHGPMTRLELFNYHSNAAIALPLLQAIQSEKPKKKKANPQLEIDERVIINDKGLKELLIDSDDDIEEITGSSGRDIKKRIRTAANNNNAVIAAPYVNKKHVSKRKMRRELKHAGQSMPVNLTTLVKGISDKL